MFFEIIRSEQGFDLWKILMMILNQIFIIGNPTIIHENQKMMAKKPENTCQ